MTQTKNQPAIDDRLLQLTLEARKISIGSAVFACHLRNANKTQSRELKERQQESTAHDEAEPGRPSNE